MYMSVLILTCIYMYMYIPSALDVSELDWYMY